MLRRALIALCATSLLWARNVGAANSTYNNPILPGFHPDPSCIFVPEEDNTFFCASSSFQAFPGIPIHASKDLQNWKLISNVLNRGDQLPVFPYVNRSTSGIWAPALRYRKGTFYVMTTLVFDNKTITDSSRWDNMIFTSTNPFSSASWSNPVHFNFTGYDTSPYWADDGTVYVTGAHPWQIFNAIGQTTINLKTGKLGPRFEYIYNGTAAGGIAPEGPHIYRKDGWFYLMFAQGGTGLQHEENIVRSKNIWGPWQADAANPIITNANTSQYFQTVGHADLFQDPSGNWWGVALSTRSGPDYVTYPMGRETVLYPVTWNSGAFPYASQVQGTMNGWKLPKMSKGIGGEGTFITAPDDISFAPGSTLPIHFIHWRTPINGSYTISPPGHPHTLRLTQSTLNLTALDGNYAGPTGQTFVGRRQVDTLFTYSVNMDFTPTVNNSEAGISVFLTQNHHIDMGLVLLPTADNSNSTAPYTPYFRLTSHSYLAVPAPVLSPVPTSWLGKTLYMEIKAFNLTHYSFSAGPADAMSQVMTIGYAPASYVSFGFTGTILGVYATSNGGAPTDFAYVSNWKYNGQGQFLD